MNEDERVQVYLDELANQNEPQEAIEDDLALQDLAQAITHIWNIQFYPKL